MATSARLIQYIAGGKIKPSVVHLHCRVKPNASKVREGVTSVAEDAVELCVAARPRDGESNKAVLTILSEALGIPKTDINIARGARSRQKLVSISGREIEGGEHCLERLLNRLGEAAQHHK